MEFDEDIVIEYMRANAVLSRKYDDDQLLNVVDIIWDYYEDHGLLDICMDDSADEQADIEQLIRHVRKMLAKDKHADISPEDVEPLVRAELAYEDTLGEL